MTKNGYVFINSKAVYYYKFACSAYQNAYVHYLKYYITHFSKEFYFLLMWRLFSFSTGYNGFCKDTIRADTNKKLSYNN